MINKHFFIYLAALLCLICLAAGVGFYYVKYDRTQTRPQIEGLLWPNPKRLQAFTTTDLNGKAFGLEQLRGKWSFLFFGYTHCPDVCPLTLAVLNNFLNHEKGKYKDLQVAFVTVDPDRDSRQRLKKYVNYFNPGFIGLRGNIAQIKGLAGQLGVAFSYGKKSRDGSYTVNHSAAIFLIDPKGREVAVFTAPHQVDSIKERYKMIRDFIDNQS